MSTIWLTAGEAAHRLGVSIETVRRYLDEGRLVGYTLPSGHRRIDATSVDKLRGVK